MLIPFFRFIDLRVTLFNNQINLWLYFTDKQIAIFIIAAMAIYASINIAQFKKYIFNSSWRTFKLFRNKSFFFYLFTFGMVPFSQFFKIIDISYNLLIIYMLLCKFGFISPYYLLPQLQTSKSKNSDDEDKYQRNGLTDKHSIELKNKLLHLFHHEKPYLKNDLRLDDLATMMNLSRHHIS